MEIIAHRGLHREKREENTLRAFSQAVIQKCSMLELDVRRTKDYQLVVLHDPSFNVRGEEIIVGERTLEHLIDSDFVIERICRDERTIIKVPTLRLTLHLFLPKINVNVELKDKGSGLSLAMLLERMLAANEINPSHLLGIIVSSFLTKELEKFQQVDLGQKVSTGLLLFTLNKTSIRRGRIVKLMKRNQIEAIHLSSTVATSHAITYFKNKGFKVRVYTINNPDQLEFYEKCKVDGIFTDKPEECMRITHRRSTFTVPTS